MTGQFFLRYFVCCASIALLTFLSPESILSQPLPLPQASQSKPAYSIYYNGKKHLNCKDSGKCIITNNTPTPIRTHNTNTSDINIGNFYYLPRLDFGAYKLVSGRKSV
jgi:hypothetical protein